MLLKHLKNSLNTWGKPTKFKRSYELLPDGRHSVKWVGSKGNKGQEIYIGTDPDGNIIKCFVCGTPCLTSVVKYQRKNDDHKKRHTCTRKCQEELTRNPKWNPLYIKRDDNGWFIDNNTGYKVRRYRPILGKPRVKEFYHRYVMEQHLGRKLLPSEHIHHIDMDKLNNNISNLWLCSQNNHLKSHHSINPLIKKLIKKGILKFNLETGIYYLEE